MGKWFKRFFENLGHEVIISGRKTADVIKEIGGYVREDAVLMDFTSVKEEPVKAMLKYSKCEVIGCHPVFGQSVSTIKNQAVVLCPARGKKWFPVIKEMFENAGAKVKITTPEKHDEIMAIIQGITHFNNISVGYALKMLGADVEESLEYASPIYKLKMDMVGRILNQNADMYADIELVNKRAKKAIKAYVDAVEKLHAIIESGNREKFIGYFNEASSYLGDFRKEAEEYSNYIIEKLVERKNGKK